MIILTDLSEVLIRGINGMEDRIEERYGKKYAKRFLKRRQETNTLFCELMRGRFPEDIFWEVFLQERSWPFGVTDLKEFLSYNITEIIPGTFGVFERIISYPDSSHIEPFQINGRPEIWLVSDHIAEREFEIEFLHPEIFKLTTKQIWSFKQSKIKKDRGFFQELLAGHDLFPSDVVFVDDLLENAFSAASAGIATIKFNDAAQLETDLGALGFKFADKS